MKRFLSILLCLALVLPGTGVWAAQSTGYFYGQSISSFRNLEQTFTDEVSIKWLSNTGGKKGFDSNTEYIDMIGNNPANNWDNTPPPYHLPLKTPSAPELFEPEANNLYYSLIYPANGADNTYFGPSLGIARMAEGEKAHISFMIKNDDFNCDKLVYYANADHTTPVLDLVTMSADGNMIIGDDGDSNTTASTAYSLNRWYKIDVVITNNASSNDTVDFYLDGRYINQNSYADITAKTLIWLTFVVVKPASGALSTMGIDNICADFYSASDSVPAINPSFAYSGFEGMHTNSVGADGFKADSSNTAFTYNKVTGALGKESTDTSMKLAAALTGNADAYELDITSIKTDGNFSAGSQLKFSTSYAYKTGGGADTFKLTGTSGAESFFTVNRSTGVLSAEGSSATFTLESQKWYNLDTILTANADSTLGYTIYVNGIPEITGTLNIASLQGTGAVIELFKVKSSIAVYSDIDMSDPDSKYFIYDKDGTELKLDDIEENTVAGYVVSDDKRFIKIKLYDNAYGGIIEEKTSEGKVKIRDNYYTLSDYYLGIKTLNELSLGTEVICYLGEGDDIVYLELISGDVNYAFIADAAMQPTGIERNVSLKLMTSKDGMTVIDLADKVNINGTVKEKSLAYADINTIKGSSDKYRVVKFTLNNEGKINKILSAECINDLSDIYDESAENDRPKAFLTASAESANGYYAEGMLTPFFVPSASCSIIMIPKTAADKLNDENYEVLEPTSFQADESYEIIAYDVDAGGVPKFMVVYTDSSLTSIGENTKVAIVEKKYTTIDEDGNIVDCIKAFTAGAYQMFYITDETPAAAKNALSAVAPGDWVRLAYNAENEITAAMHDYVYLTRTVLNTGNNVAEKIRNREYDFAGGHSGFYHEYLNGYIYGFSGNYARLVSKNPDFTGAVEASGSIMINLGRGTTIFCRVNKDRQGNVIDAEVFTEADFTSVETIRNSGSDADFMVTMQRIRQSGTNVIYVD